MKHKHKWKMIDKTILESPVRKLIESSPKGTEFGYVREQLNDRIIFVFQCELCSKIKIEER